MSKKKIDFFFQFFLAMTFFFTFKKNEHSVKIYWGPPLELLGTPPGKKVFISKIQTAGPMTPKLMVLSLLMGYTITISLVASRHRGSVSTRHRFFVLGTPGSPVTGLRIGYHNVYPKNYTFQKSKKKKICFKMILK